MCCRVRKRRAAGLCAFRCDFSILLLTCSQCFLVTTRLPYQRVCVDELAQNMDFELQGLLVSEKELRNEQKPWPQNVRIAVDMHGENQRVKILPEKTRLLGVSKHSCEAGVFLSDRLGSKTH